MIGSARPRSVTYKRSAKRKIRFFRFALAQFIAGEEASLELAFGRTNLILRASNISVASYREHWYVERFIAFVGLLSYVLCKDNSF